jgi:Domain of unknown function (DUF397)
MDLTGAVWRKSSYSSSNGGACVEVATVWRKSSYSGSNGGACVEVASAGTTVVAVRDSKDPDGPKLAFPAEQWRAFTRQIKAGAFDRS